MALSFIFLRYFSMLHWIEFFFVTAYLAGSPSDSHTCCTYTQQNVFAVLQIAYSFHSQPILYIHYTITYIFFLHFCPGLNPLSKFLIFSSMGNVEVYY